MNVKLNLRGMKAASSGHPWVRRGDLSRFSQPPPAGSFVRLQDAMGNFLAHAVSDGAGGEPIYRVLSRERHPEFGEAWFRAKVEAAVGARPFLRGRSREEAGRLIHGEADGLPGVFCDAVGKVLTVAYASPGLAAFAGWIEAALWELTHAEALWRREEGRWALVRGGRRDLRLPAARAGLRGWLRLEEAEPWDFPPAESAVLERLRARPLPQGSEACALFSRRGFWAAAALSLGASKALCLDRDFKAQAFARESLELSGFDSSRVEQQEEDAFKALERLAKSKRRFAFLAADMPQASASRHGRFSAAKDYPKLAARALPLLAPGGRALFCFPGQGSGAERVREVLLQCAAGLGLKAEAGPIDAAPPDFPRLAAFPEGRGGLRMDVTLL